MNVLALVTDAYGGYGGIAQFNRDLLRALGESPRVGRIETLPRRGCGEAPSRKILQHAPRASRTAYSLRALELAARGRFDVVFCGHLYHAPLAALLCRLTGAKFWLQTHGVEAWARPRAGLRRAVARADLITSVSRFTRRQLLAWAPVPPARARVLPNSVREMFSRREPGVAKRGGERLILTVSRLDRGDAYKGHDRVLEALPAILAAAPEARWLVVGDGDGRAALEAKTQARGLEGAVRFLGRLADAQLVDLYRSADLFLMPSVKEGFGIVFLEAAACGLPVVAGDADGSVDALAEGALGALVDPHDAGAIASAVIAALAHPATPDREALARFAFPAFSAHVDSLVASLFA
jgi:phosphatidylinositol alpha-1,6-mannosyltransferase